jgi:hypothetical protein
MTNMKQALVLSVLVIMISVISFSIQNVTAAGPLDLTGVNNFAILATTFTSDPSAIINGDLGYAVSPATSPTTSGTTFIATDPTYIVAETAQAKLIASANNSTQTGTCTISLTAATVLDTLPQPLTPGVYCITGAVSINNVITLSGDGVYIFRMGGALNTVALSTVTLAGNAKADNVFWVPVGATTLGANSHFTGNVLSNAAITVSTLVTVDGRILSNGAVTIGASATTTTPTVITIPVITPPIITPQVNTTIPVITIITPPTVTPRIITLFDQTSCQSPSIGGVWNNVTSACDINTLVIGPADTLVVASNVVLNMGTITSSGIITNNGAIHIASGGVMTTSGTVTNNGIIASNSGTITNSGPFNNFGIISSSGTITNDPTGVIQSDGIITSSGVITSSGTILVNETGILINNGGILTNTLNIVNHGTIMTSGTFTNSGPVMNTGHITNQGLITNSNTITNTFGSIFNLCGGIINNSGTISGHIVQNTCI